jgi:hypothetical protein
MPPRRSVISTNLLSNSKQSKPQSSVLSSPRSPGSFSKPEVPDQSDVLREGSSIAIALRNSNVRSSMRQLLHSHIPTVRTREYQSVLYGNELRLNHFVQRYLTKNNETGTPRYETWFGNFTQERHDNVTTNFASLLKHPYTNYTYECQPEDCGSETTFAYV